MTELETLQRAKMYIDKLANGINPLDDNPIAENDVVNNVRLSRCFFYVSDILRQVIENNGIGARPVYKQSFSVSHEALERFPFLDVMTVTQISDGLNSLINTEEMRKISYRPITDWLIATGFLEVTAEPNGKKTKRPTPQSEEIGIYLEKRIGAGGEEYQSVRYNRQAQQFIIDNIDAIINMKR